MRQKLPLLAAIAVFFSLFACSDQEESPAVLQEVQFGVTLSASGNAGGRISTDLPGGSELRISISNSGGAVLSNRAVEILKLGDSYITAPLSLPIGRYSITEFLVVNRNTNEVLFAVPKSGSPLSSAVAVSLPFSFVVSKEGIKNIDMAVISTTNGSATDFGYASFNIDIVNPVPISVFIEENGKLVFTQATATIYKSFNTGDVLDRVVALEAKLNYVNIEPNDYAKENPTFPTIPIVVEKEGYVTDTRNYTYNSIIARKPIEVILRKKLVTMTTQQLWGDVSVSMYVRGEKSLTINWGDGTIETKSFVPDEEIEIPSEASILNLTHNYGEYKQHDIMITGDTEAILIFENDNMPLTKFDFLSAPTLYSVTLKNSSLAAFRIRELHYLTLESTEVQSFEMKYFNFYGIDFTGNISTSTTDVMVNEIYTKAIQENATEVDFNSSVTPGLSPASQQKISELENNYGWF